MHSETILRNKLTSLNLEKNIVIYTIMTIKGTARRAWHLAIWLKKDAKIGPHNDDLYPAQMAQTSIVVLRRCLPLRQSRDPKLIKRR